MLAQTSSRMRCMQSHYAARRAGKARTLRRSSVLQRNVHAFRGQAKFQADVCGDELDDHAVLILEIQRRAASGHRDAGTGSNVVPGEVGKLLQPIDVTGGREIRRTDVDDRNAFDRELVRVVVVVELTVT